MSGKYCVLPPENSEPYRSQRCIKKTLLLWAFLLELFLGPLLKTAGCVGIFLSDCRTLSCKSC